MNTKIDYLNFDDITELNFIKPDYWASIDDIHRHYLNTSNCSSIKVLNEESKIVGIGTAIEFGKTGWLAHIIVSKENQRNGIGTLIVKNRIEYLHDVCNCTTITLTATDDGYPIYKKLGFKEESLYRIMTRPLDLKIELPEVKEISRIDFNDHEAVLKMDRIASGEDRGNFLKEKLNGGYVYKKDDTIFGYYLPNFGDSGVIALSEIAGIELLKRRIKEDKPIYLPEENRVAYDFLISCGYKQVKQIYRMVLGNTFEHQLTMSYSRIGGFAS